MPRPLLSTPTECRNMSQDLLSASPKAKSSAKLSQQDQLIQNRILRKRRSKRYMDLIHTLDAGGKVNNQEKLKEIIDAIKNEFPEVELQGVLLGIVAKCYMGAPYEVHTVSMGGGIIEHYKVSENLPDGLEKARSLAAQGNYDFIEVYDSCMRAISADGTVSVITG